MHSLSRRTLAAALWLVPSLWCADASLDFVQLSDTHLINPGEIHPALASALQNKKDSAARLPGVLRDLDAHVKPAFVLITGDLIDGYLYEGTSGQPVRGPMRTLQQILARSPIPIYPTLGNHDITRYHHDPAKTAPAADQLIAAEARAEWARAIPNFSEGTYYAFTKQVGATTYVFLALDDGDGLGRNLDYSAAQVAWVKRQIAAHSADPVILTMHIPLKGANFWDALRPVLAAAPNVALSIVGHRHSDGMEDADLGTCQLPQVRTAAMFSGDNHWRKFRLAEDRIEIFASGKTGEVERVVQLQNSVLLKRSAGR